MESKFLLLAVIVFGCAALLSAAVKITASNTGNVQLGSATILTCSISPYTGSQSWTVDSVLVSDCGIIVCAENTSNPVRYSFMSNTTTGIFIFTIDPLESADIGNVIECLDGSNTASGKDTFTIFITDADTTDDCGWCVHENKCYKPWVCIIIIITVILAAVFVYFVVRCIVIRKANKPHAPTEFSVSSITENSIAVKCNHKSRLSEKRFFGLSPTYMLSRRETSQAQRYEEKFEVQKKQFTFKDLNKGTHYVLNIHAVNRKGESPTTEPLLVRTKGMPDEPTEFKLAKDGVTKSSITVQWKPGVDGGYEQSFILRCIATQKGCHDYQLIEKEVGSNTTRYTFEGLLPGKYYTLSIFARNKKGQSLQRSLPLHVRMNGIPDEPTEFKLADDGVSKSSITVQWKPGVDGGYEQRFILRCIASQKGCHDYQLIEKEVGSSTTRYTFENLLPGTYYTLSIFAINKKGQSLQRSLPLHVRTNDVKHEKELDEPKTRQKEVCKVNPKTRNGNYTNNTIPRINRSSGTNKKKTEIQEI